MYLSNNTVQRRIDEMNRDVGSFSSNYLQINHFTIQLDENFDNSHYYSTFSKTISWKKKNDPLIKYNISNSGWSNSHFWGYRSFISHVKQNVKKRWGSLLIILHNKVHLPSKGQVWPDFFHFFLDAKDSVSDTAHLTDLFTKFNKVTCSFKLTVWI